MIKRIYFSLTLSFFFISLFAQDVVINEFSTSNLEGFQDEFGRTEDWVELYNTTNSAINISGWYLSDKQDNPSKFAFPEGTIIEANGYLVIMCSGRDLAGEEYIHSSFKLAQTSGLDIISLADAGGTVVDMQTLRITQVEHSNARATDGSNDWMVCTEPTLGETNNASSQYQRYTATPRIEQQAGFYQDAITVSIVNNEAGSTMRYTTDGRNVTANSPVYTGPIEVSSTTVVKAMSFSDTSAILPGKMDFATFFINENDFTVAVFSVASDQVINLANGQGDLIPIGSLEYFDTEGNLAATSFGSLNRHGQDSWRLQHRSIDWVSRDEMGYSKAVNAPLFSYSDREEYQKFMFRNSGDDNYPARNASDGMTDFNHRGSTHIRDEYVQNLSREGGMELDTRAVERVVLFLNGEYWGLYGMRERPVDHDYTDYYYKQGKYEIQYLSTWGDTEAEYGGNEAIYEWEDIRNFCLENDMSDDANYQVVADEVDLLSMIDYLIVNLNVVASDWMNYNTGWWRGLDEDKPHKKWGYILWDLDATFDYYINYSGVPNISPEAAPCDIEDISDFMDDFFGDLSTLSDSVGQDTTDYNTCPSILDGTNPYPADDEILVTLFNSSTPFFDGMQCCDNWNNQCQQFYDFIEESGGITFGNQGNVGAHEKMFLKLLEESETFKQLYYGRYADLMNTVYTCENMIETLERMVAVIDPEMDRQIARWGGTRTEWESNVEDLKEFINQRCELLDDGLVECYEVTGPYELTLMTEPDFAGEIDINTLDIREFPWTGEYFGGMVNNIKARVFDEYLENYVFSHWESASGNIIFPSESDFLANITLTQADTLTAVFSATSSLTDLEKALDLSVFPNPAKTYLTVNYNLEAAANVRFELVSVLGQSVKQFTNLNAERSSGEHSHVLPLEGIISGMYMLKIDVGDETFFKKVNVVTN
jgi:hypothetical protein